MKEKDLKNTWQYSELRRLLEEHSEDEYPDSKTIYLANPYMIEKLFSFFFI